MRVEKDEILYAMNLANMVIEFEKFKDFIKKAYPDNKELNPETVGAFNQFLDERVTEKVEFVNELGKKYVGDIPENEYYYVDFFAEDISTVTHSQMIKQQKCQSCSKCSTK